MLATLGMIITWFIALIVSAFTFIVSGILLAGIFIMQVIHLIMGVVK